MSTESIGINHEVRFQSSDSDIEGLDCLTIPSKRMQTFCQFCSIQTFLLREEGVLTDEKKILLS